MPCGNYQHHVVFKERLGADVTAHGGPFNERKLNLVRSQCFEYVLRITADRGDGNMRMKPDKTSKQIWQQVLADCLRGADGEPARRAT